MSIANWNPAKLTLVVDLDDTLISTDTLLENFWLAWSVQWRTPIDALKTLAKGKLALKQKLHDISAIDPARLPYNPDVLDVITQWRSRGGRVALVTGATQQMADAVAEHLGIFDAAHGSCDGINLTGAKKAQFLDATFGPAGYSYIGDAPADLLSDIVTAFVPRGWFPPVTPGTRMVTIGGMGLTGIIVRAAFRMLKIETAYICQRTLRAANLEHALPVFERSHGSTYSVA